MPVDITWLPLSPTRIGQQLVKGVAQTMHVASGVRRAMHQVDAIHVHATAFWGFMPAIVVALMRPAGSCRMVLTLHGAYTREFCDRWSPLIRSVCHRYDAVTVPSSYLVDLLKAVDVNAQLLPNIAPSASRVGPATYNKIRTFISLRPHVSPYNVDLIAEGFESIAHCMPDGSMTIVCADSSELSKVITDRANRLSQGRMMILPALNHDEVMRQLAHHDFMISASSRETFGIGILEAMVNGTIPICADVGNVRALIGEEERGYLIRELTAPGIASAMRRAVTSSSSTRARMRAEMAEFVKKYSWNSLREVYLARIFDAN